MSSLRESFCRPEVHSTIVSEKKSGGLAIEVSLMEMRSVLNAQLFCVKVCERNVLC